MSDKEEPINEEITTHNDLDTFLAHLDNLETDNDIATLSISAADRPVTTPSQAYIERLRRAVHAQAVRDSLNELDGTPEAAVKLLTGVDDLDEYGGMPKS